MREQAQVVESDRLLDGVTGRSGYQLFKAGRAVRRISNRDMAGAAAPDGLRAVLDDGSGFNVLQNPADLSIVQAVVNRSQRRAEQPGGEQRFEERRVVRSQPRHPVALRDAQSSEAVR